MTATRQSNCEVWKRTIDRLEQKANESILTRTKAALTETSRAFFSPYVILPVALGGAIYVLFRSERILMNVLLSHTFLRRIVAVFQPRSQVLPLWEQFAIYSAPEGLWAFAFAAYYGVLWSWRPTPTLTAATCVIGFSVGMEFMQLVKWIPGTFDVLDIASLIPSVLGIVFVIRVRAKGGAL